jgi:predicted acyltransferase
MAEVPHGRANEPIRRSGRIASVDAYRGLVMFLMLAEVLRSCDVSAALPGSPIWASVCREQSHAAWTGCSLHDLIQPGFYFLVGVGLVLSIARRVSSGESRWALTRHALFRSGLLVLLGMTLVAVHPRRWSWWFDDTLTQIGLAYPFLFFIARRPRRDWWVALGVILFGYWLWFALHPLPAASFDYAGAGVSTEWLRVHGLTGFATHWQKNSNAAWAFDYWFLNLFPRDTTFIGNENGLTTLNFIPSIGTMILGLIAGDVLRSARQPRAKLTWLCIAGSTLLAVGWILGAVGVAPVVKAIWTPSWVLFSGGWCCLALAGFFALVDLGGFRRLVFPLIVIGANSVVAYGLSHLYPAFAFNSLRRVFGGSAFELLGRAYEPMLYGCAVFALYWLVLFLLYRRRVFVRI